MQWLGDSEEASVEEYGAGGCPKDSRVPGLGPESRGTGVRGPRATRTAATSDPRVADALHGAPTVLVRDHYWCRGALPLRAVRTFFPVPDTPGEDAGGALYAPVHTQCTKKYRIPRPRNLRLLGSWRSVGNLF